MNLASRLHLRLVHHGRVEHLAHGFATAIPRGTRTVLDVGCGDGLLAKAIVSLRPELDVRGVDVLVRETVSIPVMAFDGCELPVDNGSVDVVTFADVLHHTYNQRQLLAEAARVARSAVVIKDHLAESRCDDVVLRMMDFAGNRHAGVALPYNYLSRRAWDDLIASAGLMTCSWDGQPAVYDAPLRWLIGRQLHILAVLQPGPDGASRLGVPFLSR
jgi:SAM-dependent methyltransferase